MKKITFKTIVTFDLRFEDWINPPTARSPFVLILFLIVCFAFLPRAQAVITDPEGYFPGFNTAEGEDALFSLTTGTRNTAIGYRLYNNTSGVENTANGVNALLNTTGSFNTATGAHALIGNTTGHDNTANGRHALYGNRIGNFNTATGAEALYVNNGSANTATGYHALFSNTNGNFNTAVGVSALSENQTGDSNTAIGWAALSDNTGNNNTAVGLAALTNNRGGGLNTAVGEVALQSNVSGTANTATGVRALNDNVTGFFNTAYGYRALENIAGGLFNIAVGSQAGGNLIAGNNNIYIGNSGEARDANTIRIGRQGTHTRAFVAGIFGSSITGGTSVVVTSNGRLGTVASSQRFKDDIKPMDKASEAILALKPVTFRYKEHIDPDRIPQFGLIAEDVAKVNPDLVVRDTDGKLNTVRYDAVNAMLLNEFLKEHKKVDEQGITIRDLKKDMEVLTAQLKEQAAEIRAVRGQVEMGRPLTHLVLSNP
jgi:trimeric autotransporter adhesin